VNVLDVYHALIMLSANCNCAYFYGSFSWCCLHRAHFWSVCLSM